jgi:hypothetical protein
MIGRWISLPYSSASCIRLAGDGKGKASFGGPSPKKGCSMLDLSTVAWFIMTTLFPCMSIWWTKTSLRVTLLSRRP